MKIKLLINCLVTILLSLNFSSVFAYVIYNNLPRTVYVRDIDGFGGMSVEVSPGGHAACDPNSSGCSGNIGFNVISENMKLLCKWFGKLGKERGNYFVIDPTHGDRDEVCKITQYKD